jgi:hypothetical protein
MLSRTAPHTHTRGNATTCVSIDPAVAAAFRGRARAGVRPRRVRPGEACAGLGESSARGGVCDGRPCSRAWPSPAFSSIRHPQPLFLPTIRHFFSNSFYTLASCLTCMCLLLISINLKTSGNARSWTCIRVRRMGGCHALEGRSDGSRASACSEPILRPHTPNKKIQREFTRVIAKPEPHGTNTESLNSCSPGNNFISNRVCSGGRQANLSAMR